MEIRFDGKKALVTGAGKGIGRSIAIALAKGGAETYALSRTQADLDSLKQELPQVKTRQVDLTDWENTRNILRDIGPFDLLVNNAAIAIPCSFMETTQADFDRLLDTNLKAVFNVSQVIAKGMMELGGGSIVNISSIAGVSAFKETFGYAVAKSGVDMMTKFMSCELGPHKVIAKGMMELGGGSIVNISSIAGVSAFKETFGYAVAKSGVDMMTKFMSCELGPHKIRVNSVQPTFVMTDMVRKYMQNPGRVTETETTKHRTPLGRFAEIEEVVHPVLYLLSDKSGMITGTQVPVDGGFLAT